MFESTLDAEMPYAGAPGDEDWFDPAWLEEVPPLEGAEPIPVSACAPSGWLALELDHATADPGVLSDATLIDTIVGFDRITSWASAHQATLLAEFARRRPDEDAPPSRSDVPARYSGYAPDEIALALGLSRTAARLVMARVLVADLPATLAAWEAGTIDVLKARAITEYPGELVGYGPIPAPLAREIAAEGTWRRLLTDPASGTLLDYGHSTYTPPDGLADFVRARDVYCRNPICGQRAATADLDHTLPWPEGPTSEDNLHARCRHDHLIKTFDPGWHVTQHPDGRVIWTTPTGHTYTSRPHDYRPDPRPPPQAARTPDTAPGTGAGHDPPEDDEPPF